MTDETTTTGQHAAIAPDRFTQMHDDLVQVIAALRIAKYLFGALATLGIAGILWTNASIATINARLTHAEANHAAHISGDGHTKSTRAIADNRADLRVLTERVDRRLENIENDLNRLARQVEP